MRRTTFIALWASVLILCGCKGEGQPEATKAQPFTLRSFAGEEISLSDYKGKIVVLEWFNDECPFVKYHYDTVTTMVGLADKYKDKDVIWLAINSTNHTTPEQNKEWAAKHNLPYPILDDRPGEVGRAYGATNTPHMFIIDQRGNVVYEGGIDNAPMGKPRAGEDLIKYTDNALEELVGGKAVSVPKTDAYGCNVKYARPAPSGS